jgi:hypothetical protein
VLRRLEAEVALKVLKLRSSQIKQQIDPGGETRVIALNLFARPYMVHP